MLGRLQLGCGLNTQLRKHSLQFIRSAKRCQDKGQGQSPEEETSLGNHTSSGSSSGIQRARFRFPPQIYFHSRDWSKMLERWVIWDAGPRNSNFCHIQENSLPSHSSPPWSTFPAREYWISKVSRGQPGKIASMLAIQLIRKDRCKRRARMYMLTERDLPPACHRLALISQHAVTCLRKR